MAELYNTGVSRISYRARKFATGKAVTAYIWTPALVQSSLLTLTEIGGGLYYLDYDFEDEGTYMGKFFENGVPTTTGVFRVRNIVALFESIQAAQGGGLTIE
jgi:hypothetical protein